MVVDQENYVYRKLWTLENVKVRYTIGDTRQTVVYDGNKIREYATCYKFTVKLLALNVGL